VNSVIKQALKPKVLLLQAISLVFTAISNVSYIIMPYLGGIIIDKYASGAQDFKEINLLFIIAGSSIVIYFIYKIINLITSEIIARDLRNEIASKLARSSIRFVKNQTSQKLLNVMTTDIFLVKDILSMAVPVFTAGVILVCGSLFLMFRTNVTLTLYVLALIPIMFITFTFVFKKAQKFFEKSRTLNDDLNKTITESIIGSALIKVFTTEDIENKKFREVNNSTRLNSLKIVNIFSIFVPLISIFINIATLLIVIIGGLKSINGEMSIGEIAAFINYTTIFTSPIIILGFIVSSAGQSLSSIKRMSEVLDYNDKIEQGEKDLKNFHDLKFKDIIVKGNFTLGPISIKISKGESVGVVGSTGSGKTLLLKTLIRLVEPDEGEIIVNGENIKNYSLQSYLDMIGFVPQEQYIFNTSIRENIKFGLDQNDKSLQKILNTVVLDDFVASLKDGLETLIGERGTTISGGQKQRIMIARALIRNPQILIFDDSTSKLDNKTERLLFERLNRDYPDLTTILISQKISSVRDCDQIIVLDHGKIVDIGTHKQLSERCFTYKELLISQSNYGKDQ